MIARSGERPKCPNCGKPLKAHHRNMGKNFVGDTFIGWLECDCLKKPSAPTSIAREENKSPFAAHIANEKALSQPKDQGAKPSIGESLEKVMGAQYTVAEQGEVPEQYRNTWDAWENFQDECEKKFPVGMHHDVQRDSPNSLLPKNHYVIRRASAEWGAKWMRDALRLRLEEQAGKIPDIEAYWQDQLSQANDKIADLESQLFGSASWKRLVEENEGLRAKVLELQQWIDSHI